MVMPHTCDKVNGMGYVLTHGRASYKGRLWVPYESHGKCCATVEDLAKKASEKFNIPLAHMKVVFNFRRSYTNC